MEVHIPVKIFGLKEKVQFNIAVGDISRTQHFLVYFAYLEYAQ